MVLVGAGAVALAGAGTILGDGIDLAGAVVLAGAGAVALVGGGTTLFYGTAAGAGAVALAGEAAGVGTIGVGTTAFMVTEMWHSIEQEGEPQEIPWLPQHSGDAPTYLTTVGEQPPVYAIIVGDQIKEGAWQQGPLPPEAMLPAVQGLIATIVPFPEGPWALMP